MVRVGFGWGKGLGNGFGDDDFDPLINDLDFADDARGTQEDSKPPSFGDIVRGRTAFTGVSVLSGAYAKVFLLFSDVEVGLSEDGLEGLGRGSHGV